MRVLYFDCFSGISGDMTLGALLDLGIDGELFKSELNKLNLEGYDIVIGKRMRNGIVGTDVQVIVEGESNADQTGADWDKSHNSYDHSHDNHAHDHHCHDHSQHYSYAGHKQPERNLESIEIIIDSSSLNKKVKDFSKKVFREIAAAEAKVHNKDVGSIYFHEVGAVDSIIDIVGTAICIDLLGVERIFSSPLHDGKGFIQCQHGLLPVPVPAVMEMLSGSNIPLITEDVNTELVTPTGMALIKCMASSFGKMPAVTIDRIGYGMGKRETGGFNALRVVMGSLFEEDRLMEEIAVFETNIDDMSPEIMGFAMEKLLENGALDVFYTPIYMKKSRPAVMLTVLAKKEDEEKIIDILFRETSTLGVRRNIIKRQCMDREIVKVDTRFGEVRVKVASKGDIKKLAPEYEDCKEIARRTGEPLKSIYHIVYETSKYLI